MQTIFPQLLIMETKLTYQISMCRYRYNDNQNLVHVAQEQAINVRLINIPMP